MYFDPQTNLDHAPARTEAQLHAYYRKLHVLLHATPDLPDFAEPLATTMMSLYGAAGIVVGRIHGYGLQIECALGCLAHMTGAAVELEESQARLLMTTDEVKVYTQEELQAKYPIDEITLGVRFDRIALAPMSQDARPYGFLALISQKPGFFSESDIDSFHQLTRYVTMMLAEIHARRSREELNHFERMSQAVMPTVQQLQSAAVDMLQTLARMREHFMSGSYHAMVDPLTETFARIEQIARRTSDLKAVADLGRAPGIEQDSIRVPELLQSVLEYEETRMGESRIHPTVKADGPLPNVEGDFSILWQAIHEIVLNALDALETQPNGTPRELILRSYAAPNLVQIEVEDNGPGIASSDRPRLCEAGFTTRAGHKGLGLARAKLSILRLHGQLIVGPGASGGTKVTILFPDEEHTPQIEVF